MDANCLGSLSLIEPVVRDGIHGYAPPNVLFNLLGLSSGLRLGYRMA